MQYDYIIVGAGSAGCVLANRLSANPGKRVLLLEAGEDFAPGREPHDILDPFPSSYYNRRYYWPKLRAHWRSRHNSSPVQLQQGRSVGGGGTVMGMIALRGTPKDYDGWEALGARGWSWNDVLPHFRKLEDDRDFRGELHGNEGPVPIRRTPVADWPPLAQAAGTFASEMGLPHIADMNADFRDGYGSVPMSNTLERRASSALCYLDAAVRARANLEIQPEAYVTRVLLSGLRATGVEAVVGGETKTYDAVETILSAGAIFSPAVLLRSGIGPGGHLSERGIAVAHDLPGVGRNLQNHAQLFIGLHLRKHARQSKSLRTHHVSCFRLSSAAFHGGSDLYIHIVSRTSWNAIGNRIGSFAPYLLQPESRGSIELASADPREPPRIEFNFMDAQSDVDRMMEGFRFAVHAASSPAVAALARAPFPIKAGDRLRSMNEKTCMNAFKAKLVGTLLDTPGAKALLRHVAIDGAELAAIVEEDTALSQLVRENITGTFHPAGTCRMGAASDLLAVTDSDGRMHGIGGLRVADASIMPTVIRGNTNIPTIMIAEKVAASTEREST